MDLPTVKQDKQNRRTPDREAIKKILEVVEQSPEAYEYFADRARETGVLTPELQAEVDRCAALTRDMFTNYEAKDWMGGQRPNSMFLCLQEVNRQYAMINLRQLQENDTRIAMDFAVQEDGTFLRGYSVAGQPIGGDHQTMDDLDALSKEWMAKHGMYNLGGKLYASDEQGHLMSDASGNKVLISADEFEELFADPAEGFQTYAKNQGLEIQASKTDVRPDATATAEAIQQKTAASKAAMARKMEAGVSEPESTAEQKTTDTGPRSSNP